MDKLKMLSVRSELTRCIFEQWGGTMNYTIIFNSNHLI